MKKEVEMSAEIKTSWFSINISEHRKRVHQLRRRRGEERRGEPKAETGNKETRRGRMKARGTKRGDLKKNIGGQGVFIPQRKKVRLAFLCVIVCLV